MCYLDPKIVLGKQTLRLWYLQRTFLLFIRCADHLGGSHAGSGVLPLCVSVPALQVVDYVNF